MPAPLTLRSVSVAAAERPLLAGIDLELEEGEIVALTGPSGCGKSTLLRGLAALVDLSAGEVALRGRSPAALGWPAWRRRVTYVAQEPVMLEGTVRHNLARPFAYAAVDGEFPEARAKAWLERLGLEGDRLAQEARTLSVGERQRVALVRALAIDPEVLLLDEPTSALDEGSAGAVEALLREWTGAGRAALAATHDPTQADRLCDRRLELERYAAEARGA